MGTQPARWSLEPGAPTAFPLSLLRQKDWGQEPLSGSQGLCGKNADSWQPPALPLNPVSAPPSCPKQSSGWSRVPSWDRALGPALQHRAERMSHSSSSRPRAPLELQSFMDSPRRQGQSQGKTEERTERGERERLNPQLVIEQGIWNTEKN